MSLDAAPSAHAARVAAPPFQTSPSRTADMMRAMLLASILMLAAPLPAAAYAFTCDQVRWAVRTFPASVIRAYARRASADDLARARRCLHPLRHRNAKVTP
jgi:hypothetical protein